MTLAELQRAFLALITEPLAEGDRMRPRTRDGQSIKELADVLVKPSARLTSFERLELYNTGYWFRILASLAEDFRGVRALVGDAAFRQLSAAYLDDCPPPFDLGDLGARLAAWLREHPDYCGDRQALAADMARLEWAEIEASNAGEWPSLSSADLAALGEDPQLQLQPSLRLIELAYPLDDLLIEIREGAQRELSHLASNAVTAVRQSEVSKLQAVPEPQPVHLAVHRHEGLVYFKRLPREGFIVLGALIEGRPLSDALAAALSASTMDPAELSDEAALWFADWASLGWFCTRPG